MYWICAGLFAIYALYKLLDPNVNFDIGRTRLHYDEQSKQYKCRFTINLISNNIVSETVFDDLLYQNAKAFIPKNWDNWVNGIYIGGQDTNILHFKEKALYLCIQATFDKNNTLLFHEYIELMKQISECKMVSGYYKHPLTNHKIKFHEKLNMNEYIESLESDYKIILQNSIN